MSEQTIYDYRNSISISRGDDDAALSFLKPKSGGYDDHLIVIFEDAYGDFGASMMHKKTIQEKHDLDEETINTIFKLLSDGSQLPVLCF